MPNAWLEFRSYLSKAQKRKKSTLGTNCRDLIWCSKNTRNRLPIGWHTQKVTCKLVLLKRRCSPHELSEDNEHHILGNDAWMLKKSCLCTKDVNHNYCWPSTEKLAIIIIGFDVTFQSYKDNWAIYNPCLAHSSHSSWRKNLLFPEKLQKLVEDAMY